MAYVGVTRARQQLYLSYAEQRTWYGQENYPSPSRFVGEIPADLIHNVRARAKRRAFSPAPVQTAPAKGVATAGLQARQRVRHPQFGDGVVLEVEGAGYHARARVDFPKSGGSKWLVLAYAKLEVL